MKISVIVRAMLAAMAVVAVMAMLSPVGLGQEIRKDRISIQIVWDNSGSMNDNVTDESGNIAPKSVVAKNAFVRIVRMMADFSKSANSEVYWGVITLNGSRKYVLLPMQQFYGKDASRIVSSLPAPGGNTPLGEALRAAYDGLPKLKVGDKNHIFVLSDGEQNGHVNMNHVVRDHKKDADVYFVAFDISADKFAGLKSEGVYVAEAKDSKQLFMKVQNIFATKILLERED